MTALLFILLLVLFWIWVRQRLGELESRSETLTDRLTSFGFRLDALENRVPRPVVHKLAPLPPDVAQVPVRQTIDVSRPPSSVESDSPQEPAVSPTQPEAPTHRDWEATLGGNWLNKAGVLLLVIGLALALGYSFTHIGPGGRVAISLAISLAMLITGAVYEPRPRYRIFARGLLGGGWAGLYTTVYAMHAIREAMVIQSASMGALLLIAVAAAMILHTLRYRSETVTGVAYFVAFLTLVITQVNSLAVAGLIPLAASLLYLAHRFGWWKMALFGLIATYVTCVLRGDTGAPLWQAQGVFAAFAVLFEVYDILHPESWLLPLNAAGFLGLSLLKWHRAAPEDVWMLLAGVAAAYLVSALVRTRSGKWHGAATLAAALAAAAIFQKLDHQWVASALAVEAELIYLAGLRLRQRYLRWLGTSVFAVELLRLLMVDLGSVPSTSWIPVASVDVVLFYLNRLLNGADVFYGYAGAFVTAVILGKEAGEQTRGLAWFLAGAAAFLWGWWRQLLDFRIQGYVLALLGAFGIAVAVPQPVPALATAAALFYAATFATAQLPEEEGDVLRTGASVMSTIAVTALLWRVIPGDYLGLAWMASALVLMELGLPQALALAALGAARVFYFNAIHAQDHGPWIPRMIPVGAAALSYLCAWRARIGAAAASAAGTIFLMIGLWALLPAPWVAPVWAALALALLELSPLRWQSYAVAGAAALYCFAFNIVGSHDAVSASSAVIAILYAGQLLAERNSAPRVYFALLGTALTTILLFYQVSGKMLTVSWGIEGAILLAAGFLLRERMLRLPGLTLLLGCILKLFLWDLRHLDTLPRIFSFIVLGLILVGVSWVYSRFREQVARLL